MNTTSPSHAPGAIAEDRPPSRPPDLTDFERGLAAVTASLVDRGTIGDIARRSGHTLPPASWALLEHLDSLGPLRVSDIAACHGVDVSSVTPRLKALETAGLVTRDRLPADARVFLISITPQGSQALESVHAARRDILSKALSDVDPAMIAIASDVLARIAKNLSDIDSRLPDR